MGYLGKASCIPRHYGDQPCQNSGMQSNELVLGPEGVDEQLKNRPLTDGEEHLSPVEDWTIGCQEIVFTPEDIDRLRRLPGMAPRVADALLVLANHDESADQP